MLYNWCGCFNLSDDFLLGHFNFGNDLGDLDFSNNYFLLGDLDLGNNFALGLISQGLLDGLDDTLL